MIPISSIGRDAAQLVQGFACEIPNSVGVALWRGWSVVPAPFCVPCPGIAAVGERVDGGTLGAWTSVLVPQVFGTE